MKRIALVWSAETAAAARRKEPTADLVSFLWRDYPGPRSGVALGEEGLDYRVTATSYDVASDLAQGWHRRGGRDVVTWKGTPLVSAVQTEAFAFFQPFIRASHVLEHVIATFRPESLVYCDDGSPLAAFLRGCLTARGIQFDAIPLRRRPASAFPERVRKVLWPVMFTRARQDALPRTRPPEAAQGQVQFWGQIGDAEVRLYAAFRTALGRDVCYVAANRAAGAAARRARLACLTLFDRYPSMAAVSAIRRALARAYADLVADGSLFEDTRLNAGVAAFFRGHFPFRPSGYLITVAMMAAAVEDFLDRWRPSLVVHSSDAHMAGRLVTLAASRRSIPTLVIQNHITGGPTFGYLPLGSSLMAAWGDVSRDWLVAGGAPAERVVVTGSWYAALLRGDYVGAGQSWPRRDIVVATNTFDADQDRALAYAAAAFARERAGYRLVFRPHPAEPETLYHRAIAEYGLNDAVVVKAAPLKDVLAGAAAVVTMNSGVGVDAILAGVPLVHANLMAGLPDYIPYVEYGAAVGVRSADELGKALEDVLATPTEDFDDGRRAFAAAYLGSARGDPFANLAACARRLLGEGV